MSPSKRIDVVVTIEEAWRDRADTVITHLKEHGFELSQSLEAIGVALGSAPAGAMPKLSDVKGVSSVEESRDDYRPQ
jgi:hypothetical protein